MFCVLETELMHIFGEKKLMYSALFNLVLEITEVQLIDFYMFLYEM